MRRIFTTCLLVFVLINSSYSAPIPTPREKKLDNKINIVGTWSVLWTNEKGVMTFHGNGSCSGYWPNNTQKYWYGRWELKENILQVKEGFHMNIDNSPSHYGEVTWRAKLIKKSKTTYIGTYLDSDFILLTLIKS